VINIWPIGFYARFSGIDSLTYSGSEDEEDDETTSNSISSTKHHLITGLHGSGGPGSILPPTTPEANNNSLSAGDLQAPHSGLDLKEDSEDQGKRPVHYYKNYNIYTWTSIITCLDNFNTCIPINIFSW